MNTNNFKHMKNFIFLSFTLPTMSRGIFRRRPFIDMFTWPSSRLTRVPSWVVFFLYSSIVDTITGKPLPTQTLDLIKQCTTVSRKGEDGSRLGLNEDTYLWMKRILDLSGYNRKRQETQRGSHNSSQFVTLLLEGLIRCKVGDEFFQDMLRCVWTPCPHHYGIL